MTLLSIHSSISFAISVSRARTLTCLYDLQPTIPHLTYLSLHRCVQRHGISRLPDMDGDKPKRQRFKR
jgi:hypothetical protein